MAKWCIETESDGRRRVRYLNPCDGTVFDCGVNRADLPVSMLIDWCAGESEPGDLVMVDGEVVALVHGVGQA